MIGKMIAKALAEAMEDTQERPRGAPIPLNEAAQLVQKEHADIIDELLPAFRKAELEMKRLGNRLEEERTRWSIAMREAQPELKDIESFEINDAHTHCRVIYDSEEERNMKENLQPQPEWARHAGDKPN